MTTQTDHGAQPDQINADNAGATPQSPMDISQFTEAQLLAAIINEPAPDAPQATPEPETPEPAQADHVEEGKGKDKAIRVRLTALPPDQQVETLDALELIKNGQATDILDALQQLRGVKETTAAATQDQEQEANSIRPESDAITELESTLKDLRAKRREAKSEYDADLEDQLTEQIEDTQREIALETARKELRDHQSQALQADYQAKYREAVSELDETYPEVLDDDSEFTQLLQAKMDSAKLRKDPGLGDPRFILTKAAEVHALLNRTSGRAPQPPPVKPIATGASVASPRTASPRPTIDQMRMAIEIASVEDLLRII